MPFSTGRRTRHLQTERSAIYMVAAMQATTKDGGNQMKGVGVIGRVAVCAVAFFALAVLVLGGSPTRAEAAAKHCGTVVRGVNFGEVVFYKANVLIVQGGDSVQCSEARKLAFRGISIEKSFCSFDEGCPLRGWMCKTKSEEAVSAVKCVKEGPRRVVKTTRPKVCRECHGNRR